MEAYVLLHDEIREKLLAANIRLESAYYKKGDIVLKRGDISNVMFIIEQGEADVYIMQERKIDLALLQAPQFFGEMSCLTGDRVSAHVEAATDLQVTMLNRDGLMLLMDEHPRFRQQLIEAMVNRIKNSNERVVEEHKKSTLIQAMHEEGIQHSYGELIGESEEMQKTRKAIIRVANERAVAVIGEQGTEKLAIARVIHEQSERRGYPFVVVNGAQLTMEQWANHLLIAKGGTIVIDAAQQLPFAQLQELLAAKHVAIILLVTEALPSLSLPFVSIAPLRARVEDIPLIAKGLLRKIDGAFDEILSEEAIRTLSIYPYLADNVKELERVLQAAYILSDGQTIYPKHLKFGRNRKPGERPKVGVAFGSGSTRGLAHLGVWKELEDAQIPIDLVAGTSIGSVIAGAIAVGFTNAEAVKMMEQLKWSQIVRPTIPYKSIVQNGPLTGLLQSYVGNPNIEDLTIPFAAVASELSTGDAHIMRSGSLIHAISASTAIPSLIRPVEFQGKQLIDGAVVHPVPAALVRSMGADIVIASNICKQPSAKGEVRHFMDTLMHTIDIMSSKLVQEELQLADVIIQPDFEGRAVKFKDFQFSFTAGRHATAEKLAYLQERLRLQ